MCCDNFELYFYFYVACYFWGQCTLHLIEKKHQLRFGQNDLSSTGVKSR